MRIVMMVCVVLWACSGEDVAKDTSSVGGETSGTETSTSSSGTTGTTSGSTSGTSSSVVDASVLSVEVSSNPTLRLEAVVDVELSAAASVAVACSRSDRADEVHLVESISAKTSHRLRVNGLVAETTYACVAAAVDVLNPAPMAFTVTTEGLPSQIPNVSATGNAEAMVDGPYTLFSHQRLCMGQDTIRLVAIDPDGVVRWHFGVPATGSLDMGAEYWGEGLFLWGGVSASEIGAGRPRLITASHEVVYTASYPQSDILFHHTAEKQSDGTILTLVEEMAYAGDREFTGFAVHQIDPATDQLTWYWNAQVAIDAGTLSTSWVTDYGANWAGVVNDGVRDAVVVSMCDTEQMIAIDPVSGDLVWALGERSPLELVGSDEWLKCSHGSDVAGNRILAYDNGGWDDPVTRVVEYAIDATAGTATQTWEWREPEWSEPIWGDVDYLSGDHVLITKGHSCISPTEDAVSELVEVDRATDEVVWRAALGIAGDGVYNANRIGGCELFANARFCPEVAERLTALEPWLGEG